jgi:DNA-binding beta-propeller fold protein YncE
MLSGLPGAVTDLSVSGDGRHLVAAHYGDDALSVIDIATLTVSSTVADIAEPYAVTTSDRAYVRTASIEEDSVVAVDLESGSQLATREVGVGAQGLVVGPGGERLYVARVTDGKAEIAVVDVESGAISTIPLVTAPGASVDTVRINADGTRLYAALTTHAGGALVMVDVRTGRVQTVGVGESIGDIATDHSDRRVFVTGTDAELGGVLRIIDTATARLVHTLPMGGMPVALLVSGGAVYVADGETVVAIDAATAKVAHRTAFGRPVSCLAISQDGTHLYVGDFDGNVEALPVDTASAGRRATS